MSDLRNILVEFYPEESTIRRVLDDSGVDPSHIIFGRSAIDVWHSVLKEAERVDKIDVLMRVVSDEYGNNPKFLDARDTYQRSVKKEISAKTAIFKTLFASRLSVFVIYTLLVSLTCNVIIHELYYWLQNKLGDNYRLNLSIAGFVTIALFWIISSIIPIYSLIETQEDEAQNSAWKRFTSNFMVRCIIFYLYLLLLVYIAATFPPFYRILALQIEQAKVNEHESLIVVADFESRSNFKLDYDPADHIYDKLNRYKDNLPIKILRHPNTVDSSDSAKQLAQQYHCQYYIVVYGWYDGAALYPYLEQQKIPCSSGTIDLKHLSFSDEKQFKLSVTEDLPNQITYLAYLILGRAQKSIGNSPNALQFYNKAFEIAINASTKVDITQVVEERAEINRSLGNGESARQDYTKLIERDANNPTNYYNRGLVYLDEDDSAKAVLDFTRAISLYNQTLQLNTSEAEIYRRRGFAYLNIDNRIQAIRDFQKQVELLPNTATAYRDLGYACRLGSQFECAIQYLTKAIELNANDADAYTNRGLVYKEQNDYSAAIDDFTEAIKADSSYIEAYRERGHSYIMVGRYEEALGDFNYQIELTPKSALAYRDRGWLHSVQQDWDKAIADYSTTLSINSSDVDAYFNRGKAYLRKDNKILAEQDFQKVISLAQSDDAFHALAGKELDALTQSLDNSLYSSTPTTK